MRHDEKASPSGPDDCSKSKWQLHHTRLPYIHCAHLANSSNLDDPGDGLRGLAQVTQRLLSCSMLALVQATFSQLMQANMQSQRQSSRLSV